MTLYPITYICALASVVVEGRACGIQEEEAAWGQ